ncbi:hypothetical protein SAY87_021070 [Trapa incisa]|uniref:Late embryogenesis abundant protein LEA-2 subgroup domain-containing protein n=2 Tax=Trapa TaxID=22665 RepID=A0AAN7MV06_TRANT|nr:hypothetical protein SAY87_021070 [Trapa incisa]KAK4804487.1 hypothetical protein SAY86_004304 [Trapa natans]
MNPKKYLSKYQGRRTHPVIWCAAIICAVLAVAVIIAGIVVCVGYIIIHPRIPFISVLSATLDAFQYDEAGLLVAQMTMDIRATNDNGKARASFQDTSMLLVFGGTEVAQLVAPPFEVERNGTSDLHYVVESRQIPLNREQMELMRLSLRWDEVGFDLRGKFRAQWRVGLLSSFKFWCYLKCRLRFHLNGTFTNTDRCSSRAQ